MTGRQVILIMIRHGWSLGRITGSHHVMVKPGHRSVPVPVYGSEDLGFKARIILRQARIKL